MKIIPYIILFILSTVFKLNAQNNDTILHGKVIAYKTKMPIPVATISIVGTTGTSFEIKTNEYGNYFVTKNQLKEGESYVIIPK